MLLVFFDHNRITVPPEMATSLREKLSKGGVSCGAASIGITDQPSTGLLLWTFDGCPEVSIEFEREDLLTGDGIERIAGSFLQAWRNAMKR